MSCAPRDCSCVAIVFCASASASPARCAAYAKSRSAAAPTPCHAGRSHLGQTLHLCGGRLQLLFGANALRRLGLAGGLAGAEGRLGASGAIAQLSARAPAACSHLHSLVFRLHLLLDGTPLALLRLEFGNEALRAVAQRAV
jgi:hypothetical protein